MKKNNSTGESNKNNIKIEREEEVEKKEEKQKLCLLPPSCKKFNARLISAE